MEVSNEIVMEKADKYEVFFSGGFAILEPLQRYGSHYIPNGRYDNSHMRNITLEIACNPNPSRGQETATSFADELSSP